MSNDFEKCMGIHCISAGFTTPTEKICKHREDCLRFTVRARNVEWFLIPVYNSDLEEKCSHFKGVAK